MKNLLGKSLVKMLALALGIACTQSAPAQTFKRVMVKGGAALVQIAAGGSSVWARASNGNPYIFKSNKFVLANSISLTQIAVGGGNARQPDEVWGLDSAGSIYRATKSGTLWIFNQVPGILDFIVVGIGYEDNCHPYETWGLNPSAAIFRFNYCSGSWEQTPGTLQTMAVGGGEVWGLNGNGEIYLFRSPSFARVGTASLTRIAVGPDGAWGRRQSTHAILEFQVTQGDFFDLFSPELEEIQAGGDGVWAFKDTGEVYRLQHGTKSFARVPGVLSSISVGSGAGVWGLDSSGKAYAFTMQ